MAMSRRYESTRWCPLFVASRLSCEIDSRPRNSALQPLRAASSTNCSSRGVGSALAGPPFPERLQRAEEILGVTRVRADVVIPENHGARRARGDLADDLVDGTIPDGRLPVEERDRAVVAAVRTASRRYRDRLPVPAPLDEVPARCRHSDERRLPARD